jgi:hypothetical protein
MKTKLDIIKETFDYYNEDPSRRAKVNGRCEYLNSEGNMCAFGRCEINPPISETGNSDAVDNRFSHEEEMNGALKEEYRGHSMEFWEELQDLHDSDFYWLEDKASEAGQSLYRSLVAKY